MNHDDGKTINASTCNEFIEAVVDDFLADLTDEEKEIINDDPGSMNYHFGSCMYIRNHYIYNNMAHLDFDVEPDTLSSSIMNTIVLRITGDDPLDTFQYRLYGHKEYIRLRKVYRKIYGRDAKELTEEYRDRYPGEEEDSKYEVIARLFGMPASFLSIAENDCDNEDIDTGSDEEKPGEKHKKESRRKEKVVKELIMDLAEQVWRADTIRDIALEHGIEERVIEEKIQGVRNALITEKVYIPMGTCLLLFRDQIGEELYSQYRDKLIAELDDDPHLMEKLDLELFRDRELARAVLKHPFAMGLLKEYQTDDEMVRYALECDGAAIHYVDERYKIDREWVKLAIEHSERSRIMELDCMERYRNDREFVYFACKANPENFRIVDKVFYDDYDLVHMILSADNYKRSIVFQLSRRLKDDVSIAILEVKADLLAGADMSMFSGRIRDNEEVAEAIIKYQGLDSWAMYTMSDRIKEKYGFDINS